MCFCDESCGFPHDGRSRGSPQHQTDPCETEEVKQSMVKQPIISDPETESLPPAKDAVYKFIISKDSYNIIYLWGSILSLDFLLNTLFSCGSNKLLSLSFFGAEPKPAVFCTFIQNFVINNGITISMIFLSVMLVRALFCYLCLVYTETNFDIEDQDEEVGTTIAIHQQGQVATEELYKANNFTFYGRYAHIREKLDYNHHNNYTYERQMFQDFLISNMINAGSTIRKTRDLNNDGPIAPWILFTAGAMGVGKSYTMKKLVSSGRFPAVQFIKIDPDEIRRLLPEFQLYLKTDAERAGELTQKEAGYIAEILTEAVLERGMNVVVDGSLRDAAWYRSYFKTLRLQFPTHRLAIIHVLAPREAVFQRAANRASFTGRTIPKELLDDALEQVPKSMKILAPLVDYFIEIRNAPHAPDVELVTKNETWETFQSRWSQ